MSRLTESKDLERVNNLDSFVQSHLDLQVKVSYRDHHDFLLRHGLGDCSAVLDVGTGSGTFVRRLAEDHPGIQFVGIDKRKNCIESCAQNVRENLSFSQVDMFSRKSEFDFSQFDGFLMRYFLLHVDHAHKILDLFKEKAKRPSTFWVIDLDWSEIHMSPVTRSSEKLIRLVREFCSQISIDSQGGKEIVPLLRKSGFQNIEVEHIPFSATSMALDDFVTYLRQEMLCYSIMSGKGADHPDTQEILRFIDEDVKSGKCTVSYGMILVKACITSQD